MQFRKKTNPGNSGHSANDGSRLNFVIGKMTQPLTELLRIAGISHNPIEFKSRAHKIWATDGNKTINVKTKNEKVILFLTKFNSEKELYRFLKQIVDQCEKSQEYEITENGRTLLATIYWRQPDRRVTGLQIS